MLSFSIQIEGRCRPWGHEPVPTGLIRDGDVVTIDVATRSISVGVDDDELARRREEKGALRWRPENRDRQVSTALRAYASMASSADKGAVRILSD